MQINNIYPRLHGVFCDSIVASNIVNNQYAQMQSILFIEPDMKIEPNMIYIGKIRNTHRLLRQVHGPISSIFIIIGDSVPDKLPNYINYIVINTDISHLFNVLSRFFFSAIKLEKNEERIHSGVSKCLNGKITNEMEIRSILSEAMTHLHPYYSVILVFFRKTADDPLVDDSAIDSAIVDLRDIFPDSYIGILNDRIVIIYTYPERNVTFPSNIKSSMETTLANHNAYASISTNASKYVSIHTLYNIVSVMADVETRMGFIRKNRVFLHEEYGPYYVFDLCCKQFEHSLGNRRITYLAHPAVIALKKYDYQHGTNLCLTLKTYLLSNSNATLTASKIFTHRNTVLNQLNKIKDIIENDLSNNRVRFYISFSFFLLDYYEKYMGGKIKL